MIHALISIDGGGGFAPIRAVVPRLGKTALLPSEVGVASKRGKEGARGGTMGSPAQNEWAYSCRLVDLIPKLL